MRLHTAILKGIPINYVRRIYFLLRKKIGYDRKPYQPSYRPELRPKYTCDCVSLPATGRNTLYRPKLSLSAGKVAFR